MEAAETGGNTFVAHRSKTALTNRLRPECKRVRSDVTNGERAFTVGNGQSPWGRRQLDLIALHAADAGGFETLSEAQLSLCKRAAAIETELEMAEGRLSLGLTADLDQYGRLADLRRILETLGIQRVAKPVQGLHDYFEIAKAPEEAAE
jgi:hypothetical protein